MDGANDAGGAKSVKKKSRLAWLAPASGILIILIGLGFMLYPSIGNYINSFQHREVVEAYTGNVEAMDTSYIDGLLEEARAYNGRLYERSHTVTNMPEDMMEEYNSMLSVDGSDAIGYIEIPKIHVYLPIYHGTSEKVLQSGIGHLEGSSLPVGGENTHTVLTGHSGLPSVKIFTDLDQMEAGDKFKITVLNQLITYEVDSIKVILPENAIFQIPEGGDECTLITCTPIGVNTHRLLVHGHRVENEEIKSPEPEKTPVTEPEPVEETGRQFDPVLYTAIILAVLVLIIAGTALIIRRRKRGE